MRNTLWKEAILCLLFAIALTATGVAAATL